MNLNEWRDEVHKVAREKGWWEENEHSGICSNQVYSGNDSWACICLTPPKPVNIPEKLALIHSELSEALEDFRSGKMYIWYTMNPSTFKPEGFPIEIADVVIRVLDLMGWFGIEIDEGDAKFACEDIPGRLYEMHSLVTWAYDIEEDSVAWHWLESLVDLCFILVPNLEEAIKIKHEYNKTRPYRHGGKAC